MVLNTGTPIRFKIDNVAVAFYRVIDADVCQLSRTSLIVDLNA